MFQNLSTSVRVIRSRCITDLKKKRVFLSQLARPESPGNQETLPGFTIQTVNRG